MSYLQTLNSEISSSLNNFKIYTIACNDIEKKVIRINIQYDGKIE